MVLVKKEKQLNVLDLFSGIGGFSLGLERAGMETVLFCEVDPYAQKVLKKHWPDIPIHPEIETLTYEKIASYTRKLRCDTRGAKQSLQGSGPSGETQSTMAHPKKSGTGQNISGIWKGSSGISGRQKADGRSGKKGNATTGTIDLVCGGFPCQPYSIAGKRKGTNDDRAIWPEMFRIIQEVRPRWVIGENVTGFINMGLENCLSDLEGAGYEAIPIIIPACSLNAPHRRSRIFIVAYADNNPNRTDRRQKGKADSIQKEYRQERFAGMLDGTSDDGKVFKEDVSDSFSIGRRRGNNENDRRESRPLQTAGSSSTHQSGNVPHADKQHDDDSRHESSEVFGERSTQTILSGSKENVAFTIKQGFQGHAGDGEDRDQSRRIDQEANGSACKGSLRNATKQGLQDRTEGTIRQSRKDKQPERSDRGSIESMFRGISDGLSKKLDGSLNVWNGEWEDTPRVSKGVPKRVDRLKCLGNAVIPQIIEVIGNAIIEIDKQ